MCVCHTVTSGLYPCTRTSQMECYQLRQDAVLLHSTNMKLKNQHQLKKLKTLTKSTMTDLSSTSFSDDPLLQTKYPSSIAVTDSATQVDLDILSPVRPRDSGLKRPKLRDAQVSPLYPWNPLDTCGSAEKNALSTRPPELGCSLSYLALAGVASPRHTCSRVRHRAYSDGDILLHKRRAKIALASVQDLSKSFHGEGGLSSSPQPTARSTASCSHAVTGESASRNAKKELKAEGVSGVVSHPMKTVHVQDCIGAHSLRVSKPSQQSEMAKLKSKKRPAFSTGPHKCMWQQQAKSLQQRIKTLSKQVS